MENTPQTTVQKIIQSVEEGELREIDALIAMREIKTSAEIALATIKKFEEQNLETIASQASEYPRGYMGYSISMVQGRKTYDFSNIPEHQDAKYNLKTIEDKYKAILEAKIKGAAHADITEDGEVLTLPEIKYSAGYLRVAASKNSDAS